MMQKSQDSRYSVAMDLQHRKAVAHKLSHFRISQQFASNVQKHSDAGHCLMRSSRGSRQEFHAPEQEFQDPEQLRAARAVPGPRDPAGRLSLEDAPVPGNSSVPDNSSATMPCKRKSVAETIQMLLAGLKKKKSEDESEDDDHDDEEQDEAEDEVPKKRSKKKCKKKSKKRSDDAPKKKSKDASDEVPKKKSKKRDGKADAPSDSKKMYMVLWLKNIWD